MVATHSHRSKSSMASREIATTYGSYGDNSRLSMLPKAPTTMHPSGQPGQHLRKLMGVAPGANSTFNSRLMKTDSIISVEQLGKDHFVNKFDRNISTSDYANDSMKTE